MKRSVSAGSCPSNPITTSRPIADGGGPLPRSSRHSARNGHASTDATTTSRVTKTTRNDDITANPAPGPM